MYTSIVTFFQSGGPFMYPIMGVLAFGLAIAIERYIYLTAVKRSNRKLIKKLMPLLQNGDFKGAHTVASQSKITLSKMAAQAITRLKTARRRDDIEATMEKGMMEIIPRLAKRTHYLAMFANIATLLGLLGTIIGLINAFTAVAQVDAAMKAEILSTSISVAMNTTAFGLIVAIPLIFIYTVLQTKTTEIVDSLEMAMAEFTDLMIQRKNIGE